MMRESFERMYGSHTPDGYRERLWQWFSDTWTLEFGVRTQEQPVRTAEELAGRRIGEAEKIATTLLADEHPENPALAEWVERVVTDSTYAEHLDIELFEEIVQHTGSDWRLQLDRAICILATQVVEHRRTGEVDTEYTVPLYNLVTVTSSLAASVVEYVRNVTGVYAARIQRLKLGQPRG